jgi:hypothetical protein
MIPNTDRTVLERNLDWICRLYIEEVWAYLYPSYRSKIPANEQFLRKVEKTLNYHGDVHVQRQKFANTIKQYARTGIRFTWNCDPIYKLLFENYCEENGTKEVMKTTARLIDMKELLSYIDEWVSKAAYYLWESEGRPSGRDRENWERAFQSFVEAHSE